MSRDLRQKSSEEIRLEPATVPQSHRDILEKKGFAHVATIGPDGEPHSNPVWFDFDGTHVLISQTTSRQKMANFNRDPRVALSVLDPDDPYRYLEIRGTIADIQKDTSHGFINSLAKKYMGKDEYPEPGEGRVIVKIAPERFTSMG
ncbi:MAG: PPOX class F420-dependent oxidoreductase [Actinobacteria bacterium]|nr:PPOX class F420-dependent oxidoreductase [Actinomycetota bacterium]